MRAIMAAIIAIVILYLGDQEFAAGYYADAVKLLLGQMRHSLGI